MHDMDLLWHQSIKKVVVAFLVSLQYHYLEVIANTSKETRNNPLLLNVTWFNNPLFRTCLTLLKLKVGALI